MMETISLWVPPLTDADRQAVGQAKTWETDERAVTCWEAGWETEWQRRAVAFASPGALIETLAALEGWSAGETVAVDALLSPSWREALTGHGLRLAAVDIDPERGVATAATWGATGSMAPVARVLVHAFGLPAPVDPGSPLPIIEEISALPRPVPGAGCGRWQMAILDGNRLVSGGGGAILLGRDEEAVAWIRKRRRPPGTMACLLGCSQWARLATTWQRQQQVAERYLAIRGGGLVTMPPNPPGGRGWEGFWMQLASREDRDDLQMFLNRSGILAAPPLWWRIPEVERLAGVQTWRDLSLALPCYPQLGEAEQTRVINRVQRWVKRRHQNF